MKNRLHNPCTTCKEYDFCQSICLPCERRERELIKMVAIKGGGLKIWDEWKSGNV